MLVLNRAFHPTLTAQERSLLKDLEKHVTGDVHEELLRAARWEARQEAATASALERFDSDTPLDVVEIPHLPHLAGKTESMVRGVAAALARSSRRRSGEKP